MLMLNVGRLQDTPLVREPFEHVVVPGFVRPKVQSAVNGSYPRILAAGSHPLGRLDFGPAFARMIEELESDELRWAFEEKFRMDLSALATVVTVRGRCAARDGSIHTDLPGKVLTVLIYLNEKWEAKGGRLRLLRSGDDLEKMVVEVPPVDGTLVAFRRSDQSYHGHKPYVGERRVVQLNWVTPQHLGKLRRQELRERVTGLIQQMMPWRARQSA